MKVRFWKEAREGAGIGLILVLLAIISRELPPQVVLTWRFAGTTGVLMSIGAVTCYVVAVLLRQAGLGATGWFDPDRDA